MKCVMDLDLLVPPPDPETRCFQALEIHVSQLQTLALKVALSGALVSRIYQECNRIQNVRYRRFLEQLLTRHFAQGFPEDVEVEIDEARLVPDSFLNHQPADLRGEWVRSLVVCYRIPEFESEGAFIGTWARDEFAESRTIRLQYRELSETVPVIRDEDEWGPLASGQIRTPISFSSDLCVYVDESGDSRSTQWIGLVVIRESDANRIVESVIREYNRSSASGGDSVRTIHFRTLGDERKRLELAGLIVEKICERDTACFIIPGNKQESENRLYARGISETLGKWEELMAPIHIDTPYDREHDDRHNRDLQNQVFVGLQGRGFSCTSDVIVLGKAENYPGLGIADAIAYLYGRRNDSPWRDLWSQLIDRGKLFFL